MKNLQIGGNVEGPEKKKTGINNKKFNVALEFILPGPEMDRWRGRRRTVSKGLIAGTEKRSVETGMEI